jgi:adenylyltransferase/sulfurtransferase
MAASIIPNDRLERLEFSNDEIARYSRHLIMPEVTLDGQKRIKAASILCIGTGGLGSPIALYLAAAGVGRLGLVDGDTVDFSNLQRQILHGTKDVGRKKLNSARDKIREVNPNVQVDLYDTLFCTTPFSPRRMPASWPSRMTSSSMARTIFPPATARTISPSS